ncbi:unnamed protein product [Paramecium octaurelia]|uniref:Tetratricopeptide repeat protein n=1 Tax=Paramecium octaurelia TaxID=43137 RepID=A0A8S1U0U2_PAROT|nr:unnamed protein product [Paramecium octaurelia]
MKQQEILFKCPIETHNFQAEFACFNQFCQSNRIFCFECIRNGDHNIHSGDQRKIADLFDFLENNRLKIEEFIQQLHQIQAYINKSFSLLEQGLKNKFLLTKAELCQFDPKQLSAAVSEIFQSKFVSMNILQDVNNKSLVLCDLINKCGGLFGLEDVNIDNQDYQRIKQVDELLQNSQDLMLTIKSDYNKPKVYEAMENLKKLLSINPNEVQSLHLTAEFLKILKNYNEANIKADQALQRDPKNPQLLQTKVEILKELERFDEAIQWADKILFIDPNNLQSIKIKAECLKSLKDYNEAIRWADKALQIDSKNLCSLIIKFESLYNVGNYGDAIVWAEQALKIEPRNLQALIVKSGSLRLHANQNEAIAYVDSALKIYPLNRYLQEIKLMCQSPYPYIQQPPSQLQGIGLFQRFPCNPLIPQQNINFNKK